MTDAPDPGLTDLIAADLNSHTWGNEYENAAHEEHSFDGGCKICRRAIGAIADRVALVVEQHTNGRIAELEADSANWKSRYNDAKKVIAAGTANWTATILDRDDWKVRAEKAEAELAKYHAEERRELEWARNRARDDVRCPSCNLRYGERDQYGCIEPARAHEYDADDLRAALEGEQQ